MYIDHMQSLCKHNTLTISGRRHIWRIPFGHILPERFSIFKVFDSKMTHIPLKEGMQNRRKLRKPQHIDKHPKPVRHIYQQAVSRDDMTWCGTRCKLATTACLNVRTLNVRTLNIRNVQFFMTKLVSHPA